MFMVVAVDSLQVKSFEGIFQIYGIIKKTGFFEDYVYLTVSFLQCLLLV